MRFVTDKISWTDAMKNFIEEIITKRLDRLVDDPLSSEVKIVKLNDLSVKVEITYSSFRAQAVHFDFYTAAAEAASKLQSIIARNKKKNSRKYSEPIQLSIFDQEELTESEEFLDAFISKEKIFDLTPMSLSEALAIFDCTDYPFFVYKDIEDENNIAIIYKRYGETLGLIRCH